VTVHDVLSQAVASKALAEIRGANSSWSHVFTPNVVIQGTQGWPQPDFIFKDVTTSVTLAGEFKPPAQTKREYLTGLGQAIAYTKDFNYAALVVPDSADSYPIGNHIHDVLNQPIYASVPLTLLTYDPSTLSQSNPNYVMARALTIRTDAVPTPAKLAGSFYAKWRDASPDELGFYLNFLYQESLLGGAGTVRDRAFARMWVLMTTGGVKNWSGQPRSVTNTPQGETAWGKNFRNFTAHLGWTMTEGFLTEEGLQALHIRHVYGADSQVFADLLARTLLLDGKHLMLINEIQQFQEAGPIASVEATYLADLELYLENKGLLQRNVGRHNAAVQGVARGFLKSEKTIWRNLQLISPRGARAFYPGIGYRFNWERITGLLI
jgi:hypothetical protein